jgi:hypothetical protein
MMDVGKLVSPAILMRSTKRIIMAKGQQRGNREAKKPKADKKAVAIASPVSISKQAGAVNIAPKKKG